MDTLYKRISKVVTEIFLQFCTTYLCEQSFSSLLLSKNDKRSMLGRNWWRTLSCSFQIFSVT